MMMNKKDILKTSFCGIPLRNPLILASGILGVSKTYFHTLAENGIGAVTIKSISIEPRGGHKNPILLAFEGGLMNAVGYSNPGWKIAKEEFSNLSDISIPVLASIVGQNPEEFSFLAETFLHQGFAGVELALSCPHTPGFGTLAGQSTPEATFKITQAVRKKTNIPVFVKLSPNVPGIGELAKAAEDAGADAISACNTLG